jgi:sugar (pentulose or hexulose) kinase
VPERVLVVDAGTSALRGVLVGSDGEAELVDGQPYHVFVPEDAAPFGRELAPDDLIGALGRLLENAAAAGSEIAAVAVTGQREGIAFVDAAGAALFVSPNVDARAVAEGMAIDGERAETVYRVTGHIPSMIQAPAKLAWLRTHRPDVSERVSAVLPLVDWLATLLAETSAVSRTLAAENGLLDIVSGGIAAELLAASMLDPALVPEVFEDGHVAGTAEGGPLAGHPVVLAGADTQCALLGLGVLEAGRAGVPAGWSAPLQFVTASPVFDGQIRTWTSVHAAPGRWILESNAGETGRAWEWVTNLLSVTPEAGGRIAAGSPAGSRDVLAAIGPPRMRADSMNAGTGAITFPLPIVMSDAGLPDVLRATLEACAFAVRANLEQLDEVSGARIDRLCLGGGMSRIGLLPQLVADVIDRPVQLARSPKTSAVGAAMLAFVALGRFGSLAEAATAMAGGGLTFEPRLRESAGYDDYYARWLELCERIAEGD